MNPIAIYCEQIGLGTPEPEYRFAPPRRFRFDFALVALRVGIEIDGGTWTQGRHTRGAGFARDCEKTNLAAVLGWCVLRFTTDMIQDGRAFGVLDALARTLVED